MNICLVVLVIEIVATISYFPFAIYNIFISKKQITMSLIDVAYFNLIGCYLPLIGEDHGKNVVILIVIAFLIWMLILMYGITKNVKNYEKRQSEG